SEPLDERLPRGSVGGERVCLSARAVEREHELAARPLPHRFGPDQRLELRDELDLPAELEVCLDPLLERDEPELLESRDLALGKGLVQEVRERGPAPERERLAQSRLRRLRALRLQR